MFDSIISSSTVAAIKEALTPIALAMGQGAGYTWAVLIKQQMVIGVGYSIGAAAGIITGLLFIRFAKKHMWTTAGEDPAWSFTVMAGFMLLAIGTFCVYAAVAHFINPDYYAIITLINAVNGGSN